MLTIDWRERIKARKRERIKALTYECMNNKGKTLSRLHAFALSRIYPYITIFYH